MLTKKNLVKILITSTFALGGCEQKGEVSPKEIANIKDVDGDSKPDLVFGIKECPAIGCEWYVFYKRNIDNGEFSDPKFLYKTCISPNDSGIPYEIIRHGRGSSERDKYMTSSSA